MNDHNDELCYIMTVAEARNSSRPQGTQISVRGIPRGISNQPSHSRMLYDCQFFLQGADNQLMMVGLDYKPMGENITLSMLRAANETDKELTVHGKLEGMYSSEEDKKEPRVMNAEIIHLDDFVLKCKTD